MLERIGDEVVRATSLVRYDPDSQFSSHVHTGGEEFIVLEGVFQDEYGDYPAGSYIRNPPASKHTPGSQTGCVIFVKLWQFEPNDRTHFRLNINDLKAISVNNRPGVSITTLYHDEHEDVRIETWEPGAQVTINTTGGAEILVLEGSIQEGNDQLHRKSWLRLPIGGHVSATASSEGARVWIKSGHLRFINRPDSSNNLH